MPAENLNWVSETPETHRVSLALFAYTVSYSLGTSVEILPLFL